MEARTLAEAFMYVELVVGRRVPVDLHGITDLSYVDGHRVLRVNGWHDGEQHDFTVVVPSVAMRGYIGPGEFYGEGTEPSVLIDAGQWCGIEGFAAGNIGILLKQAFTPDVANEVAKNLVSAHSALTEIGKFLPEGADEVPAEAFWTDTGRLIRERQPESFRRDRLVRDDAEYLSMAERINAYLDGV